MDNKGQLLIITIILIVITGILLASVVFFLSQDINLNLVRSQQTKALYAAQAGIYKAIMDYRNDGSWQSESNTGIGTNISYSIGESSNFLRVDASSPILFNSNRTLGAVYLYNVNSSTNISIDSLSISWTPDNSETVNDISIGGISQWSGTAASGDTITLSYTFIAGGIYALEITWSADVSEKTISVTFDFDDGSSVSVELIQGGSPGVPSTSGADSFLIKSTGIAVSRDTYKKTITAAYDVTAQEIISWQEVINHI